VPPEVTAIQDITSGRSPGRTIPPQVQWQMAEYSRARLLAMTGLASLEFRPETILDENSSSADSTTGYMNFHLGRPAMTLEGRRGQEYSQFLARAAYTLLLAFGHRIDPGFETLLANPNPTVEPELYEGLSPRPPVEAPSLDSAGL
jgi:hypothetical protein